MVTISMVFDVVLRGGKLSYEWLWVRAEIGRREYRFIGLVSEMTEDEARARG